MVSQLTTSHRQHSESMESTLSATERIESMLRRHDAGLRELQDESERLRRTCQD